MDTFGSRSTLRVGDRSYEIFRLSSLEKRGFNIRRLPYSLRVLLENLLRNENNRSVMAADIEFLANWDPHAAAAREIAFSPARVGHFALVSFRPKASKSSRLARRL